MTVNDFTFNFGKYRGLKFSKVAKNEPAYIHWLFIQDWFGEKYPKELSIVSSNIPELKLDKEIIRTLKEEEIEKNQLFNKDSINNILRLSVTRIWGNRTLHTSDYRWLKLRQQVIDKYQNRCRFCGNRFSKYLIIDHIDGNASDNSLENLGINCKGCDTIRHCGFAGLNQRLLLRFSKLDQSEIVRLSYDFYIENGQAPAPEEIDPECKPINNYTVRSKTGEILGQIQSEVDIINLANIMLKYNYDELNGDVRYIKGFFSKLFDFHFLEYLI